MARAQCLANTIAAMKAALQSIGAITSVLYEDTTYLIFDSDCFAGVCKLQRDGNSLGKIYIGTAWTSGSTITDELMVSWNDSGSDGGEQLGCCRVAGKVLAMTADGDGDSLMTAILGKTVAGDTYIIGLDSRNSAGGRGYKNITTGAMYYFIAPQVLNNRLMTVAGNYYHADLKFADSSNILITTDILQNVKLLMRPPSDVIMLFCQAAGEHCIVDGGRGSDNNSYTLYDLLIVDGNL